MSDTSKAQGQTWLSAYCFHTRAHCSLLQGPGPTAKAGAPELLHLTPQRRAKVFWEDRALRLGDEGVGRACRSEEEYVERSRIDIQRQQGPGG